MHDFSELLLRSADYRQLKQAIEAGRLPLAADGLSQIHKALFISALAKQLKSKALVLCPDEGEAYKLTEDLQSLGCDAILYPARDFALSGVAGYSREYEHKRIDTLSKILGGDFAVCVAGVEGAVQYTLPPEALQRNTMMLEVGNAYPIDDLLSKLVSAGYIRTEQVEGPGQFALRGGILDIYATADSMPSRIEFWDDEIDSISHFDLESQRRTEPVERLRLTPAMEVLCPSGALADRIAQYRDRAKRLTDKRKTRLNADMDALRQSLSLPADRYYSLVYPQAATLFDYLPDSLLFVCESGNIKERLKRLDWQQQEDIKTLLEEGFVSAGLDKFALDAQEVLEQFSSRACYLESFARASYDTPVRSLFSFMLKRSTPWRGDLGTLLEDLEPVREDKGLAIILAGQERPAQALCASLEQSGVAAQFLPELRQLPETGIIVSTGGLSSGFEIPALHLLVITRSAIGTGERKRRKRLKSGRRIGSLEELQIGDYVVHAAHGIGIFSGIHRLTAGGVTKDYIKIQYAKTDTLYVPVTQLDLVSKYIGAPEEGGVKIHRLGGTEWQKSKSRVRTAVKQMAKQLTALYAKRMALKGYAFSEDTDLQNDFERRFEFEETEDQLRCIREIKADMERPVPMDRLLCGDVGFGKTEVALRAAFKCVSEGKQCALLVPTTILAWQHYGTVLRRFGELPVEVRLLSRFVSPKEQEKTVRELKQGRVDMVIGTHRLISKDVSFRDLGLVIIDEEQRFGVAQKERLKELYPTVDVLTLSATPIPRTLNMAMSGLRDMSSIDEAPEDRHPVQTYVLEQDNGILLDAIKKELRRGGQVYYLHNRVESISACAARLQIALPDARVAVAHGKMSEEELSGVWKRLLEKEIDVLVCTTIIETGVDVPNANTLIIEDADRMGLAQLHQLRGRVGRSPRRAYAYFCFRGGRALSDIATKRLEAIRQYTEFGSGFQIAMRDLEIRGAGSILGGEQHGHMEAVGYDMYLKLLSDAVREEQGEPPEPDVACTVDLNISANIPESYIPALAQRLGIYRRIADIRNQDDVSDVIDELCDRFGDPPAPVLGLIDIALLRNRAEKHHIYEISQSAESILLYLSQVDPAEVSKMAGAFKGRVYLSAGKKPYYTLKLSPHERPLEALKAFFAALDA